jgi:hypothetical protein
MPKHASGSFPLARLLYGLAALVVAMPARAGEVQTLTMRDGSKVTGEIVEYVAGDHVVVQIAPGERMRVDWEVLASPPGAPRVDTGTPSQARAGEGPGGEERSGGEERAAPERDERPGRRMSLGVETGIPSPLGYVALMANTFPFRGARWLGLEVAVGMPIQNEPVTMAESLVLDFSSSSGRVGIGFAAGVAQSFVKGVLPTDHAGIINTVALDLTHLTINFIPQLTLRLGWGWAAFINGGYCKPHPEACPQLANAGDHLSFYGHSALMWTLDFDRLGR